MKPEHEPEVIDLMRYKKAADQKAAQKANKKAAPKPPRPTASRPKAGAAFLGSNPRAGMILAIAGVVMVLLILLQWI